MYLHQEGKDVVELTAGMGWEELGQLFEHDAPGLNLGISVLDIGNRGAAERIQTVQHETRTCRAFPYQFPTSCEYTTTTAYVVSQFPLSHSMWYPYQE